MSNLKEEWDKSYQNKDNFVFYPHEEVIRFVSRYIRKRTGLNEFTSLSPGDSPPRVLDLGCGIGRHVLFSVDMGLDAYGIDLSEEAIKTARQWVMVKGLDPKERVIQGDIRQMPWEAGFFDFVISSGVLDSMSFEIACAAVKEVARVLRHGGLFYCDLVSGDDSQHAREYSGEEVVNMIHEQGTIQSYFNFSKLNVMIDGMFEITECVHIKRQDVINGRYTSRYHVILKKK